MNPRSAPPRSPLAIAATPRTAPLPPREKSPRLLARLSHLPKFGPMCDERPPPMFGRYRILGLLGRGGMGSVYLAEQTGPGGFCQEVVLKLFRVDLALGADHRLMLLDEAQLTADIQHPNVVRVIEVNEHAGRLCIVLERIQGISLSTLLRRAPKQRLSPPVAAALLAQACEGLHAAHELRRGGRPLNLVHRDVSQSNLMVDTQGRVRVIDFGIARADLRRSTTDPEVIRGNPAYMAPEQFTGQPLTRAADIYSTALVFYELCTGAHPFGRTMTRGEVPPLRALNPAVRPELSAVVAAALALEPGRRPADIAVLGKALGDYARAEGYAGPADLVAFFRGADVSLEPPSLRPVDLQDDFPPAPRPRTAPSASPSSQPRIDLARAGAQELALPDGRLLVLHLTRIGARERNSCRLALSRVEGLLPAALTATAIGGTLGVVCQPSAESSARPSLYLDAQQPHTRLERLLLTDASPAQTVDLGHRRGVVRRIECTVAHREGDELVARPAALDLALVAPGSSALMIVFVVDDDATRTRHVECVHVDRE